MSTTISFQTYGTCPHLSVRDPAKHLNPWQVNSKIDGGCGYVLPCEIWMQIMNNGIFRSPIHRVVTNPEKERLSLAVFYGVDGESVLEPAPGLLDEKRPSRYMKIEVKEFVVGLFEHFPKGTRFIETLKM